MTAPKQSYHMRCITLFVLCLGLTSQVIANGTRLPSQDATAVARGYAWTATADGPSAVYYNPAGLAHLPDAAAQFGVHFLHTDGSYSNGVSGAEQKPRTFSLPSFFASQPISIAGRTVTLGLGAFAPFGSETEWPSNGPFALAATRNKVTFLRYSLAIATRLTDTLSFGAAIQWNQIETDLHRAAGIVAGDDFGFAGDGHAASFNLGVMYRPSPKHSFGLQFQSQTKFDISGSTLISPFQISEPGRVNWLFPPNLALGYAYRLNKAWDFEVSYDVTFWSALNTLTLNRPVSGPLLIPFNWSDSGYFGIGGTYKTGAFRYSAGVNYSENSVPDKWFSPSVPDVTRWLINAGVAFDWRGWVFEGLIQVSPNTTRTIRGNQLGGLVNGVYRGSLRGLTVQVKRLW